MGQSPRNVNGINGVGIASISGSNGVRRDHCKQVTGTELCVASQWIVGSASGKLYHTTTPDASSGWAPLVDLGGNTYKDVAYGKDKDGNYMWLVQAGNNTNEISAATASADLTDSNNWIPLNHGTNYKATDFGPGAAWANDIWITVGVQIDDGDSKRTIMRSTDGAESWTSIDEGNTVNDSSRAICFGNVTGSVWAKSLQSHVWVSADNGANWADKGALELAKDVNAIAYCEKDEMWLAVLQSGNMYTSDDDWGSNTERSQACGTKHIYCVVYAAGSINKWIAGGDDGRLQYSSDGINWTAIWEGDDSTWGTNDIYAAATDNCTIVIVGAGGMIATSTNGTSFTIREISDSATTTMRCVGVNCIGTGFR